MPESPNTPSGGKTQAKDEIDLLEVLQVLIETEKATTTADLLKYATQFGAPEAEERLRVLEAEGIPVDLAFDSISVHLRLLAFKRNSQLLAGCRGQKVGLIIPLPPHLPNLFMPIAEVTILDPGETTAHGAMQELLEHAIKGSRTCRAKAQEMQTLVFEAFRDASGLYAEVTVADVLEPKLLPAEIRLIAHLRPHRNPKDVQIHPESEVAFL
jgi:hypothetical protein